MRPPNLNEVATSLPPLNFSCMTISTYKWPETSPTSTPRNPVLRSRMATRSSNGLSGRALRPPWSSFDKGRTMGVTKRVRIFNRVLCDDLACSYRGRIVIVPDDQDRPEDPLCFSTQQSRLIRQTWTSSPTRFVGGVDGETRTSSHPSQRQSPSRDDGAGPKTSTFAAAPDSIFRHLKNIEKVCRVVDERIQRKKIEKEWSTRMISETARLRRDEESVEDMPERRGRPRPNGDADGAKLDNTPATFDDCLRKPRPMEEEVVPTSQSLERYLSLSPLSQPALIGPLDASRAPNDDDFLDVAVTCVHVVHVECLLIRDFHSPLRPPNLEVT
jgi:hypothetical protein